MPYTQEELKNLPYYQNLIIEDEQQYLQKKERLSNNATISGSAYDGNQLIRDESNAVLLFENPYKDELLEDENSEVFHSIQVRKLRNDNFVDEVLTRGFREL